MSTSFATDLATYQNIVYGNDQLLLRQSKILNILNNDIIHIKDSKDRSESISYRQHRQSSILTYSPLFVEIIDQKDKDIVYGYIRHKCQLFLSHISKDIRLLILYYYCFGRYQYDGSIGEWSKTELYGKYLPLNPLQSDEQNVIFKGKSTWHNKHKHIKFNTEVMIKKTKQFNIALLRELKILRILSSHPCIAKLYDILPPVDSNNFDALTIIYEHMDANLKAILTVNQYFSSLHIQHFLYHILCGVQYMHSAGIVHRDLRPENILINADCTIKISGFGNACGVHENKSHKRFHRWYRAPERILLQHAQDIRSIDMWAVGCIFAELLQMKRDNCPDVFERGPLFPGDSCYPLTPKRNRNNGTSYQSVHDQLRVIFRVIGCPNKGDMEWIKEGEMHHGFTPKTYVDEMRIQMTDRAGVVVDFISATFPATCRQGLGLLKDMLKFDIRKRLNVEDALKSTYFDAVRNMDLENMCQPKTYEYAELQSYTQMDQDALHRNEFDRLLFHEISHYVDV
eukprot:105003_1